MNIFILGVGRNTPVFIDLIEDCGYKVAGLFHYGEDRTGELIHGYPVVSSNTELFNKPSLEGMAFAISVGDNRIRSCLASKIREKGGLIPTLVHPSAIVSKYAKIQNGVTIHANSVVQANAVIGFDTVVSFNSSVTHSSVVGDGCYLAAHSHIGAYVNVANNVFIGQGAVIASGKVNYIGENSIIGAGSVVVNNVEPNSVVVGNPARILRKKESDE